jgi:ribosome-associated protein
VREVPVRADGIRLGQLLKLAGLVDSGADVKALVAAGSVAVNGETETRRGRQLADGDEVAVAGQRCRVVVAASTT